MNIDFSTGGLNATNNTRVGWVQDPQGRGTASLLVSCLSTLILCVWSAMHLNVPKQYDSATKNVWEYFKWSILGVFGPELVVWTAWRQYISAQALQDESKSYNFWSQKKSVHSHHHPDVAWTMTHGFYAGMGGFVLELDDSTEKSDTAFIPDFKRLALTAHGVRLLAECGLLPQISKEEILDKSKTDGVGKFLACLQAGWMILQVVTRLIMHLPVTLLEVNTIGHVLCGLLVYILWWNKPRWIQEPTKLDGEGMRSVCAFMYMSSSISAPVRPEGVLLRDFQTTSEVAPLSFRVNEEPDAGGEALTPTTTRQSWETIPLRSDTDSGRHDSLSVGNKPLPRLPMGLFVTRPQPLFSIPPNTPTLVERGDKTVGAATDRMRDRRWDLAAEAIKEFPAIRKRAIPPQSKLADKMAKAQRLYPEMPSRFKRPVTGPSQREHEWLEWETEEFITDIPRNWPSDDLLRHFKELAF